MSGEEIKEKDPLFEWNDITKKNTINEIVTSMYINMAKSTKTIDKFSLWLLAGTGASGSLLVSQIDSILPYLTSHGFKTSMAFLIASAISGFFAKFQSLRCEILIEFLIKINDEMHRILQKHEEHEKEIQKVALESNVELQTNVIFKDILQEYLRPFPAWVKWLMNRRFKKGDFSDRQGSYHTAIKHLFSQTNWTILQGILFMGFMISGACFASAV